MNRRYGVVRALLALVGLFCASTLAGIAVAGPAAADGTAPPWVTTSPDPNGVGGLTFYDSSGKAITSGPTNSAPFAAFVQGRIATQDPAISEAKATLYMYLPQQGQLQEDWQNFDQLGLSTAYPNSAAPRPLASSTLPLNTGHANDLTLETVEGDYPNTSTDPNYAGRYEIRLYTGGAQHPRSVKYDYADIAVDDTTHTWSLVYTPGSTPKPVPDPSTLSIGTLSSANYHANITITAKLTDTKNNTAIAGASLVLRERASSSSNWKTLKSTTTGKSGTASVVVNLSSNEQLDWTYAGTSTHAKTTSATKAISVRQTVSIRATASKVKRGATVEIYGTVTPAVTRQRVYLQILSGSTYKTAASATIVRQRMPNRKTEIGYLFKVKMTKRGRFHYRVYKPATSSLAYGVSASVVEAVK